MALWQPAVGATWNYILNTVVDPSKISSLTPSPYQIWDIDLWDTPATTISTLQAAGTQAHVICYFSASSYEDWRPDASQFEPSDLGGALDGWAGENWLNISSPNVRNIMRKRLDMAVGKGCSGVDPDNMDGYNNAENGIGLTQQMSIDYMRFLANETKTRGLSIGLKNAGEIASEVMDVVQWSVNEQCAEYTECGTYYKQFIDAGKPVFHVEYPKGQDKNGDDINDNNPVSAAGLKKACTAEGATNFSTIMKNMNLNWFTETCDGSYITGPSQLTKASGSTATTSSAKSATTVRLIYPGMSVLLVAAASILF